MNRKRVLHGLGLIVLLAVVLPFVIYAVPGVIGAEQSFIILSGSMEPEMSPGDAVLVDDTDPADIEEGDVVTFARDGSDTVVTHRVVDVREEDGQRVFETKGDANEEADREPVSAENVVGTVTLTIPLIGYVVHFVNTPLGFATMVLLPLGLLAVSEAWVFARDTLGDTEEPTSSGGSGDGSGGDETAASRLESERTDPSRIESDGHPRTSGDGSTGATDGRSNDDGTGEDVDGVVVDGTDLQVTTALVVLSTPYAAYVALQLRTLPTIAIAYTVGFTAVALTGIQIAAIVRDRRHEQRPSRTEPGDADRTGSMVGANGDDPEDGATVDPAGAREESPIVGGSEFEWAEEDDDAKTGGHES